MKYLLILMILLAGCDDHKHPQRNRDKADTPGIIHDTVTVVEPCEDEETSETPSVSELPDYFVIMISKDYSSAVSNLLDAANSNKEDEMLQKNLWSYIQKYYPETGSGGWTLVRENNVLYVKRSKE